MIERTIGVVQSADVSRACLTLILAGVWLGCEKPVDSHLRRGEAAARTADWSLAAKEWDEATRLDDHCAAGFARRGLAAIELGQSGDAERYWRRAIELEPGNAIASEGLARLALDAADAGAAVLLVNEAQPLTRARALLARGAPGDAAAALETAQRFSASAPDDPAALYLIGSAQLALQRFGDAQGTLDNLQRKHPASPLGSYGLARLAAAQSRSTDTLLNLRAARGVSGASWDPERVAADPAFGFLASTPEFKSIIAK